MNQSIQYLKKGYYIFNWAKFSRSLGGLPNGKKWDINDTVLYCKKEKFTFAELEPFFTNKIIDEIDLMLEMKSRF